MTNESAAVAMLAAANTDGRYDALIADISAGKIKAGVLTFENQRALELMKDNNILGRFNDLISQAEALMAEPVVYVVTG
jgi:hypothetical protein